MLPVDYGEIPGTSLGLPLLRHNISVLEWPNESRDSDVMSSYSKRTTHTRSSATQIYPPASDYRFFALFFSFFFYSRLYLFVSLLVWSV